jgi:hypothetical protein
MSLATVAALRCYRPNGGQLTQVDCIVRRLRLTSLRITYAITTFLSRGPMDSSVRISSKNWLPGEQVRALALCNSFNSWGLVDTLPAARPRRRRSDCRATSEIRTFVREIAGGCRRSFITPRLIAFIHRMSLPDAYVATNVGGTLYCPCIAARDCGVSKVIHTSTSEVYGSAPAAD